MHVYIDIHDLPTYPSVCLPTCLPTSQRTYLLRIYRLFSVCEFHCLHIVHVGQSLNTLLMESVQLSCLPRVKYFGLPVSVTWPVYRNVNDVESSLGVGLKIIYISGGRNSSVGSAWARCPQRRGFDPPLGTFSGEGIFPLELTWVQTPFPQKLFWMRV